MQLCNYKADNKKSNLTQSYKVGNKNECGMLVNTATPWECHISKQVRILVFNGSLEDCSTVHIHKIK